MCRHFLLTNCIHHAARGGELHRALARRFHELSVHEKSKREKARQRERERKNARDEFHHYSSSVFFSPYIYNITTTSSSVFRFVLPSTFFFFFFLYSTTIKHATPTVHRFSASYALPAYCVLISFSTSSRTCRFSPDCTRQTTKKNSVPFFVEGNKNKNKNNRNKLPSIWRYIYIRLQYQNGAQDTKERTKVRSPPSRVIFWERTPFACYLLSYLSSSFTSCTPNQQLTNDQHTERHSHHSVHKPSTRLYTLQYFLVLPPSFHNNFFSLFLWKK